MKKELGTSEHSSHACMPLKERLLSSAWPSQRLRSETSLKLCFFFQVCFVFLTRDSLGIGLAMNSLHYSSTSPLLSVSFVCQCRLTLTYIRIEQRVWKEKRIIGHASRNITPMPADIPGCTAATKCWLP